MSAPAAPFVAFCTTSSLTTKNISEPTLQLNCYRQSLYEPSRSWNERESMLATYATKKKTEPIDLRQLTLYFNNNPILLMP